MTAPVGVGIACYSGSYGLSCGLREVPTEEGLLASAPPEVLPARRSESGADSDLRHSAPGKDGDAACSREDARTKRGVPISPETPRELQVRLQAAVRVPAAENETAPGAVGAPGWPTTDLAEASGISELGPGHPGCDCDRAHLLAGGRGPGLGYDTAKFVVFSGGLSQVHSSVLQLRLGLRRGLRGRERLGPQYAQKRAPGRRCTKPPFFPPHPRPALPFSAAAPAPWPRT
ncbi:hypothetical protein HJG60_009295 [Phyllostomus discolor]|uniref:Uncharacterized protein n=1 Tax=Phyllostomus discolor TaxID=89673 RepID=A0A834DDF1_9CHIR|nr:hypothetical protein HJG60_009295 [Phyllostomus discolor]